MDRRTFLSLAAITATGLVGCSNSASQSSQNAPSEVAPAVTEEISEEAAEREISADVVEEKTVLFRRPDQGPLFRSAQLGQHAQLPCCLDAGDR